MRMMDDTMLELGYKFAGTCNCNGLHTEKYKRGEYEIHIRPKSYKFGIKRFNALEGGWQPLSDLETKIKAINETIEKDMVLVTKKA